MKTLQYYMYGILFCVLSMGMGFPDIILEKDLPKVAKHKEVKKAVSTAKNTSTREAVYCTKAAKPANRHAQQKPSTSVSCAELAVDSLRDIYLKLFDKKGNLLLIENIKVEEFLSKHYASQHLPVGSKFVMFHGNTAYYYIETSI
ncbi:hypothetical protein Q0590_11555 [Rhodocytophaga aerolata]|uniref:Uncharacterized protein n=1 Tax=Rhodocytophaga aerolata TaxID=455078 RepID=A0ABT8R469_9BACT|nr:hypothetical protein [Rhodocytophaga aerolata]MDO1446894.1 hypothetical protein [Rhodocytophaga aerolata]